MRKGRGFRYRMAGEVEQCERDIDKGRVREEGGGGVRAKEA